MYKYYNSILLESPSLKQIMDAVDIIIQIEKAQDQGHSVARHNDSNYISRTDS